MATTATMGLTVQLESSFLRNSALLQQCAAAKLPLRLQFRSKQCRTTLLCRAAGDDRQGSGNDHEKKMAVAICGVCAAFALALPSIAAPTQIKLPPLSKEPNRCERAFTGNTIGQANGVADKVLDLRKCDFANNKSDLRGKTLSSALMVDAIFDGADLTEVIMSKAYAVGASFKGTDFTSAVVDRVAFDGSDMTGAKFVNTVLSGSTFEGANMTDTNFEDALIGYVDVQKLCRNPTLNVESRIQIGCRMN